MFTGIVAGVGVIVTAAPAGDGLRLTVDVRTLDAADVAVGDSIAVAGCCLTVVERHERIFAFDVSAETIRCTTGLDRPGEVNLEKALRLADRLGGHLMTGHVDGVGRVKEFSPVAATASAMDDVPKPGPSGAASQAPTSFLLGVEAPAELARYIAAKGSIAVDGVSLTVNTVPDALFTVNLIPHTLAVTTLRNLRVGSPVNLEIDLVARYVERLASSTRTMKA